MTSTQHTAHSEENGMGCMVCYVVITYVTTQHIACITESFKSLHLLGVEIKSESTEIAQICKFNSLFQ